MGKSSHFSGLPLYCQVIKLLDKAKVLHVSREKGSERCVKRFNGWVHLVVMLYAVIMRFDSLREITASLLAESRKLRHLGINFKIGRSTLADANSRRPESVFEAIYRDLYSRYRPVLSSDSRSGKTPKWMRRLQIIDSTTITLFSNLLFKGVGRHPKSGKKKGGIKVHTVIHANEGVPSDIKFTSAATNDSFIFFPKLPALLLNHLFLTNGLGYVKQQTRPLIISSRALKFCYNNFLSDSNKIELLHKPQTQQRWVTPPLFFSQLTLINQHHISRSCQ